MSILRDRAGRGRIQKALIFNEHLSKVSILRAGAGQGRPGIQKALIFIKILLKSIDFESQGWPGTARDPKSFDF